jgi:hypothetical protein
MSDTKFYTHLGSAVTRSIKKFIHKDIRSGLNSRNSKNIQFFSFLSNNINAKYKNKITLTVPDVMFGLRGPLNLVSTYLEEIVAAPV